MRKKMKIIRNIVILLVLIMVMVFRPYGYINPMESYRAREKTAHYGPADIIKVIEHEDWIIYFGEYDEWVSDFEVHRGAFGLWYPENYSVSPKLKGERAIEYSWHGHMKDTKEGMFWVFDGKVFKALLVFALR